MEVKVPQRFYDERSLERGELLKHGCTVGHERIVEHGYVKIIAGETLTRGRMSSIELARNNTPAQP